MAMHSAAVAYRPSQQGESWSRVVHCARLRNTFKGMGQNRCCFNVSMQLICGIPHIERGLQNAFDRAGRDTIVDIEALWHHSLARLVFLTVGHIKKLALTDTVGCLKWFVDQLGAFPAMRDVVQWLDRPSGILVQQDAEEVLLSLFTALEAEALDVLRAAFPKADVAQVATYYKEVFGSTIRETTTCPRAEMCKTGTSHSISSVIPIFKVGLDETTHGFQQSMDTVMQAQFSGTSVCVACEKRGKESILATESAWERPPAVLVVVFGRERFDGAGRCSKSQAAVVVQEEYTILYGHNNNYKQYYHTSHCIFHVSATSQSGHCTLAAREQQGGSFRSGDSWRFLDSEAPVQRLSLTQMVHRHSQELYAVLLVAKNQPQDDLGPLLKASAGPSVPVPVPWEVGPETPPGSPTAGPPAAGYTSTDASVFDEWQAVPAQGHKAVAVPPSEASYLGSSDHHHGPGKRKGKMLSISNKALEGLAAKAAQQEKAKAERQKALAGATTTSTATDPPAKECSTPTSTPTSEAAHTCLLSKAQRRKEKKAYKKIAASPVVNTDDCILESPTSTPLLPLPSPKTAAVFRAVTKSSPNFKAKNARMAAVTNSSPNPEAKTAPKAAVTKPSPNAEAKTAPKAAITKSSPNFKAKNAPMAAVIKPSPNPEAKNAPKAAVTKPSPNPEAKNAPKAAVTKPSSKSKAPALQTKTIPLTTPISISTSIPTPTPASAQKLTPLPAPTTSPAKPNRPPSSASSLPLPPPSSSSHALPPAPPPVPPTKPLPPPAAKKVKMGSAQRRKVQKAADAAAAVLGPVAEGGAPAKPTPVAGPLTKTGVAGPMTKTETTPQVPTAANSQQSSGALGAVVNAEPTPQTTPAALPITIPPAASKKGKPGSAQRKKMQQAADAAAGAQGHVAEGGAPAKPTPVAGPLTKTETAPQVPTAANSQQSSGTLGSTVKAEPTLTKGDAPAKPSTVAGPLTKTGAVQPKTNAEAAPAVPTAANSQQSPGAPGAALKAEPSTKPLPPPAAKKGKMGSAQRRKMQQAADAAAGAQGSVAEGGAPAKPTPVAGPLTRPGGVAHKTNAEAAPTVPTAANPEQSSGALDSGLKANATSNPTDGGAPAKPTPVAGPLTRPGGAVPKTKAEVPTAAKSGHSSGGLGTGLKPKPTPIPATGHTPSASHLPTESPPPTSRASSQPSASFSSSSSSSSSPPTLPTTTALPPPAAKKGKPGSAQRRKMQHAADTAAGAKGHVAEGGAPASPPNTTSKTAESPAPAASSSPPSLPPPASDPPSPPSPPATSSPSSSATSLPSTHASSPPTSPAPPQNPHRNSAGPAATDVQADLNKEDAVDSAQAREPATVPNEISLGHFPAPHPARPDTVTSGTASLDSAEPAPENLNRPAAPTRRRRFLGVAIPVLAGICLVGAGLFACRGTVKSSKLRWSRK